MQGISHKVFVAIEAVLYVACHSSATPMRSKDICKYQGVTLRYLEHILQQLVKCKILKGIRGPKGGYVLAKDRRDIRLSEIFDCIEEMYDEEDPVHSDLHGKIVKPLFKQSVTRMRNHLDTITLQDLVEEARARDVDVIIDQKSDFVI